jgi:hypothetical protein
MKKIVYSLFAAIMVMTATFKVTAQPMQTRNVSGFNSIASAGPFDVHVKINGTESLKINASHDIINEIETTVEDGTLKIKFKHHDHWNHEDMGKIDVYITAKSLSGLTNAGSGIIRVEGTITGANVKISLSGSGDIVSTVKSGMLKASIAGSGSIHLDGNADEVKVDIAGSGELNAKSFKAGSAAVSIAGSGSAYFAADKTISARIVGSGNVIYSGNATVDSHTIGSGRVSKSE